MTERIHRSRLNQVIEAARQRLLSSQRAGSFWHFPAYLGTMFSSQYFLTLRWLGMENRSVFDAERFKLVLLDTQNANGSWDTVVDVNRERGDLSSTVINYLVLKMMGLSVGDARMKAARAYILAKGGIEQSMFLAKAILALFGLYPWSKLPDLPWQTYFTLLGDTTSDRVTQWADPNIKPLIYLRKLMLAKDPGQSCRLDELWSAARPSIKIHDEAKRNRIAARARVRDYVLSLLDDQQPYGTWGGMSLASCFSIIMLEDYGLRAIASGWEAGNAPAREALDAAITAAIRRMDYLHAGDHAAAYKGAVMDGRYWDTYLCVMALHESGVRTGEIAGAASVMKALQHEKGGFPFGQDYEYAPDNDDTALAVLALRGFGLNGNLQAFRKAAQWFKSMENSGGGWGAFSKNRERNRLIEFFAEGFIADVSADATAADITGHVLEALAGIGHDKNNSAMVKRAIRFLRRSQDSQLGCWPGKWGINYIYATGAAIMGLLRTGVSVDDPLVASGLRWLRFVQTNADGGWGESTLSYSDRGWAGKGQSTPTQTAWALLPLIETSAVTDELVVRGINYLLNSFAQEDRWMDASCVGTGFPGVLFMDYPAYASAFPLIALARYRTKLREAQVRQVARV